MGGRGRGGGGRDAGRGRGAGPTPPPFPAAPVTAQGGAFLAFGLGMTDAEGLLGARFSPLTRCRRCLPAAAGGGDEESPGPGTPQTPETGEASPGPEKGRSSTVTASAGGSQQPGRHHSHAGSSGAGSSGAGSSSTAATSAAPGAGAVPVAGARGGGGAGRGAGGDAEGRRGGVLGRVVAALTLRGKRE